MTLLRPARSFAFFVPLLASPASVLGAQGVLDLICSESFEFPPGTMIDTTDGGLGWSGAWTAGSPGQVVTTPGMDGAGGKLTIPGEDIGAFRAPNPNFWALTLASTPSLELGADGYSLYLSFRSRRNSPGDSAYGGLSLISGGTTEVLFLGSPFLSNAWGIDVPGISQYTVPGSNVDADTRCVARIDYQPGNERIRLWLDPPSIPPTSTPALDQLIPNHTFGAIRLQSGNASTGGYHFDDLRMECTDCAPENIVLVPDMIDATTGGSSSIALNIGQSFSDHIYVLALTASGTTPGTPYGPGIVPLNVDTLTFASLVNPAGLGLVGAFGAVNFDGQAFATQSIPPALGVLAGLDLNYAYVGFDPTSLTVSVISDASPPLHLN